MKTETWRRGAIAIVALPLVVAACTTGQRTTTPVRTSTSTAPPPATTTGTAVTPMSGPVTDAELMLHAAQDGLAEMHMAQLAVQRSASQSVRQFAQQLVTDHTQSNAELMALAQARGLGMPASLAPRHVAAMNELAAMNGQRFDVAFLEHMIADHAKAVAMYERIAATAADPALRAWAARQIPALRQHYAVVNTLHLQLARTPGDVPAASPPLTR